MHVVFIPFLGGVLSLPLSLYVLIVVASFW